MLFFFFFLFLPSSQKRTLSHMTLVLWDSLLLKKRADNDVWRIYQRLASVSNPYSSQIAEFATNHAGLGRVKMLRTFQDSFVPLRELWGRLKGLKEGEKNLRCSTKGKYQFYVVKICSKCLHGKETNETSVDEVNTCFERHLISNQLLLEYYLICFTKSAVSLV